MQICALDSRYVLGILKLNFKTHGVSMDILQLIASAGIIVKIIMLLLLIASVYSWGIIVSKALLLKKSKSKILEGVKDFENAPNLREAVQKLGRDTSSPLFSVAQYGVNEFNKGKESQVNSRTIADNVRRSLHQGVNNETAKLNNSISILATCANASPFVGLFGTVWGILNTFSAIGAMKSASLATVAPGIAEALIATALGLFVAIPASVAFNIYLGKINYVENLMVDFAGTFLNRVQRELNTSNN